ncbi:NAD-dependent protein deacetylase [Saccharothrix violaceirubra]|uniref:NAD-dependent protein deacetylase n=1 Tax=Saccharothrix violaceirubra TaxID=413306 RepID=A0A7W7T1H0_9PSEU|nr:NAD-dependent protein deacetylase [Saccharothrix violaceirubra]MBB4964825.1 NAD-dependent SIR2 family protein deacetylase [Saccharothrix violaceirubra]
MRTKPTLTWTPTGPPRPRTTSLDEVVGVVGAGNVLVLSGAGLSTESGIPDYRGATGSLRTHTPMTYQDFVADADNRRRYWARSHVGWRLLAGATPNAGHHAVTALHDRGLLTGVITQNVDGLHRAAGTPDVVELHGGIDRVVCLDCRVVTGRLDLDRRLRDLNGEFSADASRVNPDGDVELPDDVVRGFRVAACADCGGVLKPDVVFFGENVPKDRVDRCYALVGAADALLVLGSSLTVRSGLRFVERAARTGRTVVIVNRGETRGDAHASVLVDLPLGRALTDLLTALG